MKVTPITTRVVRPPGDDITDILDAIALRLAPRTVVAITTKIVSIDEGRCIPLYSVQESDLVKQEADRILRTITAGGWTLHLTITQGRLIADAGIDRSNADGHYVLWPKDPFASAANIAQRLRQKSGIKDIGVILTDSVSVPLRRGVVGASIGHWGFGALNEYQGKKDIFGRVMQRSTVNLPDGLAAAAVVEMGEGNEQQPIALIQDLPSFVLFGDYSDHPRARDSYIINPDDDIYGPY